ncbi:MAG: undecaprenyldiphospho-muramoylpentapeptide beta-N-acetylglucosaminyltransferase [Syntrophales bacterium]|jgi:UDP-N-acetylglucosamine--N-acetylmuramyl-(pentapeptide) pyrophosphoryl-undecaprenol N-acetylglucosamine transferase|nr:undecaprenyldiphospho-muramoylpentapeptide beta-N-acetylglucosaminyltransferase [Syntrophales bacterium]NLN60813.1 undecaprenyldiphospho-muramoylpentapeptide beta-N-acetylglucosaminyltransferase [Deltaproteobacteria bacterium]
MNIIIAGGGTGGHLFPGIAIAEEIMARDGNNRVLFVGTERGIEKRVLPGLGYDLATIDVAGIKGTGLSNTLKVMSKLPRSFVQSLGIIRSFKPDLVLGVGGYASGPSVLTAHLLGLKTAIAEQNAYPGITNRILSRCVDRIFLTFPDGEGRFPKKKSLHTGNPIRAAFTSATINATRDDRKFNLLVFGGSQGAQAINQAVLASLDKLEPIRETLRIIHQTGVHEVEAVTKIYKERGYDADIHPFIMDMPKVYGQANLLVCRAGATSIAEMTASGRAAILIPYPYATNDHQTKNAEVLVQAGAAVLLPETRLSGETLGETILSLYRNPDSISRMEVRANQLAKRNAAAEIVDVCVSLVDKKKGS